MGRRAKGFSILWRDGWGVCRFTWQGRRYFVATGERDPDRAQAKGAQIYAEVTSGRRRNVAAAVRVLEPLEVLFARWLGSLEGVLDEATVKTYRRVYVPTHFMPFFKSFDALDEVAIASYARSRVRVVLKKTVHKELGALRGFLRWCVEEGFLSAVPPFPEFPRTVKGKRAGAQRAKANSLTEEQVRAAIAKLPLLSSRVSKKDKRLFAVRDRFVVAYETGLRPATLDLLEVPTHWRPGSDVLVVEDDMDKTRFGRTLTLTPEAKAALERTVATLRITSGLIFGQHDYRSHLANAGLDDGLATSLAPYDFRHARGTHLVNRGASLSGVAYQLGHTQVTTTNKYAHATKKAGDDALGAGSALSGAIVDPEDER
jgi:integrase